MGAITTKVTVMANAAFSKDMAEIVDSSMDYIGRALRNQIKKGIKKGTKHHPQSSALEPAHSRKKPGKGRVLYDAIDYAYDARNTTIYAGPKLRTGFVRDWNTPRGKTVWEALEYGASWNEPRYTKVSPLHVDIRWRRERLKFINERRRRRAAEKGVKRVKRATMKQLMAGEQRWAVVVIPKGKRVMAPRPTARIGLAKTLRQENLQKYFALARVNPSFQAKKVFESIRTGGR